MIQFLARRRKAIAAFVAPYIVALALKLGFDVDVEAAQLIVTAVLGALLVEQTPNRG